ncbi:MAG: hypothetical protein LBJ83_00355 [Oscillospiraceae bacterium]|jgi:ribosomal protein L14E/L6E/L27E|nr:hypothetical protein [Oscillospiraceae bacterium]
MEKGRVVKSLAGRDKGAFFAVVDFDNIYCFLVDGDLRKLEKPKKKKIKHVSETKIVLSNDCFLGNKRLKESLKRFA